MPVPHPDLPVILATLTPREREIVAYVAAGEPNKVIAIDLAISLRTVEAHRARIFAKLGVRNAMQLACRLCAYARQGLSPVAGCGAPGEGQAPAGPAASAASAEPARTGADYALAATPIDVIISDCSASLINKGFWSK
ncbi:helix-turn-helix transcriptional regulator [Achromobacter xylosoxidans]|uniref:response regulator transcription factor n=1 Tax=Alcaligenes xylosoxydans xylosoxydans TaxID=85698 RepID=UPI00203B109C|nr:helix-turn-helix transcriptional regulator [Achromobacter xylosoxidans]MCM2575049.1 helix-turn-helix transcriptional regulator [Achromobacter xylosoxidans]